MVQAHPEALKKQVVSTTLTPLIFSYDTNLIQIRGYGGLLKGCTTIISFQILQKVAFHFRQEANSGFQKKSHKTILSFSYNPKPRLCCQNSFLFYCSLVNSLLIALNFHIFTSEIFIENQQVTL